MKTKLAIVLLAGSQAFCYAQSFVETDSTANLSPSNLYSNQEVFSATRWSQPEKQVPAKIIAIPASDVAMSNPQTTADMLSSTGEVFVQKSQLGGGSPMIRGFATNRILLEIDGIRMNTAIFRSDNIKNVISVDPLSLDRTEVLFGPASVIYGSDAIGGVIYFRTLAPSYSSTGKPFVTGNAMTRFSSADLELTGHFDINIGWKKIALLTSFSQSMFNDLRMGSHGPDEYLRPFTVQRQDGTDIMVANENPLIQKPSGYNQTYLMEKVSFKPNDQWEFNYGFHYSTSSDIPRYDKLTQTQDSLPKYAEWYYAPQVWMMNKLDIKYACEAEICDRFELRVAHQYFEEGQTERLFDSPAQVFRVEKVNAFSVNFDLVKYINPKHQLYYGMEVIYDNVSSGGSEADINTGTSNTMPSVNPHSGWGSYGLYANYQFEASSKLDLQAGLRYNIYQLDADFDTTLVPYVTPGMNISNDAMTASIGAVYRPSVNWTFTSRVSTAFRSPNLDDIGKVYYPEEDLVIIPGPDLKAEYSYNFESGVSRILRDIIRIDITGYFTYLQDALVRRDYTIPGSDTTSTDGIPATVQAIQNTSHAYVAGFQVGLTADLPYGLSLFSTVNYQKGKEELVYGRMSPAQHIAPCFGITTLSYARGKMDVDIYVAYSGKVSYNNLPNDELTKSYQYPLDKNGNPYSPAWCTLNFKAMYQINRILSVSGGIENLTDVRYRPYSSGITAPGINFVFSLRAAF